MDDRNAETPSPPGAPAGKPGPRLNPYLLAGLLVLLFVVFAAGVAFATLRQRGNPDSQAWTPSAATPSDEIALTATSAGVALATAVPTFTATAEPAQSPSPAATVAATPEPQTPTPAATPDAAVTGEAVVCSEPVAPELAALYSQAELGCATGKIGLIWSAWEPFERGAMLWRQDTDQTLVLFGDGAWEPINEPWNGQTAAGRGEPPAGRVSPERGFGWVWGTRDDIYQGVGWATDREKGFSAAIQPFERGFLLRSANVPSCTPEGLYNFATEGGWRPLALAIYKEGWRGSDIPSVSSSPSAQTARDLPTQRSVVALE